MKLKKVTIERVEWGIDKGKLLGEISFENQYSKVSAKLNEDQAYKILEIVSDALVFHAQETSKLMIEDLKRPVAEIEGEVQ
jgi:hypothetical protein